MTRTTTIRLIHVAARELRLDEDTRHDLQLAAVGKASLTDMTDAELEKVVAALKTKGFSPANAARGRKGRPPAKRGDTRFAHVMWGKLHRAGKVDKGGAAGLNAFIRVRFEKSWGAAPIDIDQMRDAGQIATVVEALKAMCRRAGIDL